MRRINIWSIRRAMCVSSAQPLHGGHCTIPLVQPCHPKCSFAGPVSIEESALAASETYATSPVGTRSFDDIPGPRGVYSIPYIGTALQFYPFTKYRPNRFDERTESWHRQFGSIYKVRLPHQWNVFVFDPSDAEATFRNDNKYPFRGSLPLFETYNKCRHREPTIGERNGESWWELRSPTQKGISRPKSLSKLIPKLSEIADDLVSTCRSKGELGTLPYPFFELAAEGAGLLCFNKRLGIIRSPGSQSNREFMTFVDNYFDYFGEQLLAPIHWFKWFKTPGYRSFEKASDFLMSFSDKHTQLAAKNLTFCSEQDEFNLLHFLLTTPGMTAPKASAILVDLFRGGIDSTANAITFLLYHLAKYPHIQEKLYEELAPCIPAEGSISPDVFKDLHYLRACLKESFRLVFPVIQGTQRVLEKDVVLSNYQIPAGTTINLCISAMCKNDKYFPSPETFMPERWLRTNADRHKTHPFAYLPFGYGTRSCVGQRFAEQEIFVSVSKIIKNFKVSLPKGLEEVPFIYSTFATPKDKFLLKLEPR